MARKTKQPTTEFKCRQCALSLDWCDEALDGHLILCRCEHYHEGRYYHFLSDRACNHFKLRT